MRVNFSIVGTYLAYRTYGPWGRASLEEGPTRQEDKEKA